MQYSKSILLLLSLTIVFSCSNNELEIIDVQKISGKWEINNSQSIEFNESQSYILIELNQDLEIESHYGTYEIIDRNEIKLSNYGTLSNTALINDNFNFSIETTNGEINSYESTKVAENISSTNKSENISKTWNLISVNGNLIDENEDALHLIFSQVGTYFVSEINKGENFISQWMWQNSDEEIICYSHDGDPVCEENENEVIIIELTTEKLILDEYGEIFLFEPK